MSGSYETKAAQQASNRKRTRALYESIFSVVSRNAANKPEPLPKRQPTEAQLMTAYSADVTVTHQQANHSTSAFQYTPPRKPLQAPSIFSPATCRQYASPVAGQFASGPSGNQSTPAMYRQHSKLGGSPTLRASTSLLHNRYTTYCTQVLQALLLLQQHHASRDVSL